MTLESKVVIQRHCVEPQRRRTETYDRLAQLFLRFHLACRTAHGECLPTEGLTPNANRQVLVACSLSQTGPRQRSTRQLSRTAIGAISGKARLLRPTVKVCSSAN